MKLSIAPWKYGKDWVYSITYDEALADLKRFVIPVHQELGMPGHVEVVAGQIGKIRRCGKSSYNGMRHMNAKELRELVSMGWGIGCHSWSHGMVMDDPDRELRKAKEKIENAIKIPVKIYTAPGSNDNLTKEVQEKLLEYGYLAGLSITDDINRPDNKNLLWINRIPIHERYWGFFNSAFDAYKRIKQAQEEHGWIVDYCHCPLEKPVHEYKDCTAAHHRKRLETVVSEGGNNCWYANPDDVVDYRYMRRSTHIKQKTGNGRHFIIHLKSLPASIQNHELTFELHCSLPQEVAEIQIDGRKINIIPILPGTGQFTVPVKDGMEISALSKSPGAR